jgi:site-specific recombinase XerC
VGAGGARRLDGGDHAESSLEQEAFDRAETPLKPKDVWAIRVRLQLEYRARDLALFNLVIDSKLRGCDLVRLAIHDVYAGGRVRDRATIIQKKTGRPVQFEITEQTHASTQNWLPKVDEEDKVPLPEPLPSAAPPVDMPICAVQAWVESAGVDSSAYGTHSMCRPKAAQIYKKTRNLRAVQLLVGHTKLESTVRYLGIEVDDVLSISEQVEL